MSIIDRYIVTRFLLNFAILLLLLFVFAVAIDLILQLDRFVDMARQLGGQDAGVLKYAWTLATIVVDFHGPRIVQFYAYMIGLITIGAMGFTLAHMHRHRELVAIMASGVSLHRIAMPLLAVAFALNLVQLVSQELLIPHIAPLLLRKHGDIGRDRVNAFAVPITRDGKGHLLQAAKFDPVDGALSLPTILERDAQGRTSARITADSAQWDAREGAWRFANGAAMVQGEDVDGRAVMPTREPIETWRTDLTPEILTMHRFRQFASMLSTHQINAMLATPGVVDADALARTKYSRFSAVLINMLLLAISLPFFLLREPANLLSQSVWCAAVTVPAMLGALIGMTMQLPGIPPAVGVFLPAIVLIPVALAFVPHVKT